MRHNFVRNHPRILALPTQFQFFIKIYKIVFPGNQAKKFISSDSEFFTVSEYLFGLEKISTGKNRLLGIQPKYNAYCYVSICDIILLSE